MNSITLTKRLGQAEITQTVEFDDPIPPHEQSAAIRRAWAAFRRSDMDEWVKAPGPESEVDAETN